MNGTAERSPVIEKAKAAAKDAGLVYVNDSKPGIRRLRRGKAFTYVGVDGRRVTDPDTELRIKALVIPPAWEDVWICTLPNGHLQATGRDERGRKQSRYHAKFREARDSAKYDRVLKFAAALPKIRGRVKRDLALPGMPKQKVLAAIVSLLEKTLIRVGNERYAKSNRHFGLTTIHNNHAKVRGSTVQFRFVGKSGVNREVDLQSPRLAAIVRKCQELPGQDLFAYVDEKGSAHDVKSTDVNDYLQSVTGQPFTAKDFRTWAGTVLAATALKEFEAFDSNTQAKRNVVKAIEHVAERLGNTKAVCRKCYVHPVILESYLDGSLVSQVKQAAEKELKQVSRLPAEEAAVVTLLQQKLKRIQRQSAKAARSRRKIAR
ncbi:MAG: DNA topoisomerase IB [Tepidisphaeraceae bacterium]